MITDLIGQTIKITNAKLASAGASAIIRGYTEGAPFQVLAQVLDGSEKGELGWLTLEDFACPLPGNILPVEVPKPGAP